MWRISLGSQGRFAQPTSNIKHQKGFGVSKKQASWFYLPFDMWRAGLEAQQVIGLRLAMLAGGGVAASAEMNRMVAEKMSVALEAQHMAATAALTGNAAEIPSRTVALYRRKMRANRKCLNAVKSPAAPRPRRAKKCRPT
jgi:hypothetical protein